ncbi:hypothetical protein L3X38_014081 [Prunus dulcis]|uniref:Uncharacterized protein n=1 Tax=Prunus dulcis TaxID=3755 RepID=A0AAD4WQ57_PRUDU|nr:hypothetical protein L3X38_014081 [Prunus dulcis]
MYKIARSLYQEQTLPALFCSICFSIAFALAKSDQLLYSKAEAARTDYPNSKLAERLTQIFITSCVFGVFLDPLFLYIPLLNQDLKCLRLDNTITIIAVVLRSFTDLFYVGRIILQVCRFEKYSPSIKRFLLENCSSKLMTGFDELLPKVTELHRKENQIPSIGVEIWKSSIIVDFLAILPLPQV